MSREHVETFKRGIEAFHRDDVEAQLEIYDPEIEWHPMIQVLLANGVLRARGRESGVETESPISFLVQFTNGKVSWVRTYIDPDEALESAGLQN